MSLNLELNHVTLTFPDGDGRITAVDDATISAGANTITAITGASGSGKSSLLAVASTLITPDSGTILIDGEDVSHLSRGEKAALRREKIGIVFQQSNLLPSLTAIDQLLVMNELGGHRRPSEEMRAKAESLLKGVGLAGQEHKRPHQLSGGQRQRVNIARALMNEPTVLIVDEPTSALDQERGAAIIDLILEVTKEYQTSTLLVTHDERHLHRMSAHYNMKDGVLARVRTTMEQPKSINIPARAA